MSENLLFIQEETVTTKQAAQLLGVKESTILRYEKNGMLTSLYPDSWQQDGTKIFYKKDVEQLLQQQQKPGLTTKEAAKILDVAPSTIIKHIQKGTLQAELQKYRGRDTYFIQEDELERFMDNNPISSYIYERKTFIANLDDTEVYLFQPFVNSDNKLARIISVEGEGKVLTEQEEVFPLYELQTRGYKPKFEIERGSYNTKRGYVSFLFKKPSFLQSPTYTIIEWLYQHQGAANIRMEVNGDSIKIEVKPFLLEINPLQYQEEIKYMHRHVVDGEIAVRHNGVLLDSKIETLSFYVDKQFKDQVKMLAKEQGVGLEEFLLNAVREYVNGIK